MKAAFTMIELIFVIVILGILAAVAIPKLSTTRDDAEVSKNTQNIMTSVAEIAAYAVSQSEVNADLSKMSNVISDLVSTGDATLDEGNQNATIKIRGIDCITVQVDSNDTTDTLVLIFDTANDESICASVQSRIDASKYPMRLRGQYVVY
jgi:general secretion pathway protein G